MSDRALGCRPALVMPETFRVSMPKVWYFSANARRRGGDPERDQMQEVQVAGGHTLGPEGQAVHTMPPQAGGQDPGPPAGGAGDDAPGVARQSRLTR